MEKVLPYKKEYLFEKSCQVFLSNLQFVPIDGREHHQPTSIDYPQQNISELCVSDRMQCSYCHVDFIDRDSQVGHYKSDLHRYNIKQSLLGKAHVTESEFEEIMGSDLSSISGSDSEEEDEDIVSVINDQISDTPEDLFLGQYRYPKLFFRNNDEELFSIHRCVLYGKQNSPESVDEVTSLAANILSQSKWAIFMAAGNHFAAAIFDGVDTKLHKTFHRYIVRAKRGTAQSSHDKAGSAAKSAGANLRRYNEAALAQEVKNLLISWASDLESCHRIFVRAPSFNKSLLFGGKTSLLRKDDSRIRQIPFPTRRPTLKEIKRVHKTLATLECYCKEASLSDILQLKIKPATCKSPKSSKKNILPSNEDNSNYNVVRDDADDKVDCDLVSEDVVIDFSQLRLHESTTKSRHKKKKIKSPEPEPIPEFIHEELDEVDYRMRNELYTACKVGDVDMLNQIIEKMKNKSEENYNKCDDNSLNSHSNNPETSEKVAEYMNCILSKPFGDNQRNLLHVVVNEGHSNLIQILLTNGCDPALKDKIGKTPYLSTSKRELRNEFRRFLGKYPDKYDYNKAEIPGPLDEEKEAEKKVLENEKKKAAKKASKERLKAKKMEESLERKEDEEKQRFLNLSEREKRAIMAERRFTEQVQKEGKGQLILSRCYQCGLDITGKVPFEYYDYQFCTPSCMKTHRIAAKT